MISASVTPLASATAASAGVLFPLMEPTSAELAEFGQMLGDFNQLPNLASLSAPALTLANQQASALPASNQAVATPEGLLSTLEQGAQLALQGTPSSASLLNQQASSGATDKTLLDASSPSDDVTEGVLASASLAVPPTIVATALPSSPEQLSSEVIETHSQGYAVSQPLKSALEPSSMMPSAVNEAITPTQAQSEKPLAAALAPTLSSKANAVFNLPEVQGQSMSSENTDALLTSSAANSELLAQSRLNVVTATQNQSDRLNPTSGVQLLALGDVMTSPIVTNALVSSTTSTATLVAAVTNPAVNPAAVAMTADDGHVTDAMPLLGDNKAVMFATTAVVTATPTVAVQVASTSVDSSTSALKMDAQALTVNNMLATSAQQAASSSDQQSESKQQDSALPRSAEEAALVETDGDADEFSLTTTTPLSSSSAASVLAAPLNLRQPQWTQNVAQRVQVMVNQSMNTLEVRLDPLDLGPMKIKLMLDDQHKAHVTLSAQHGLTRDMLENALPRLKELLSQEGIDLASATVDSGQDSSHNGQNDRERSANWASDFSEDAATTLTTMSRSFASDNLVDEFV